MQRGTVGGRLDVVVAAPPRPHVVAPEEVLEPGRRTLLGGRSVNVPPAQLKATLTRSRGVACDRLRLPLRLPAGFSTCRGLEAGFAGWFTIYSRESVARLPKDSVDAESEDVFGAGVKNDNNVLQVRKCGRKTKIVGEG